MAKNKTLQITLHLADMRELFHKPDISPISERYQDHSYTTGIEFAADELYADPAHDAVKMTLLLPPDQVTPESVAQAQAAVKRYCRGRLREVTHEITALRWRGVRSLAVASVALFVLISASRLIYSDDSLVRQVISEGLSIAAWVSFWVPLEMLIFKVWEQRLDRKIYTLLSSMEVVISPTD